MNKPHVIIVGSGFGGVYTARHLEPYVEKGLIDVTILNRTNYFLFTPLLHEVATGGLSPFSIAEPLREVFRKEHVQFIQTEAKDVDLARKVVVTSSTEIPYDYLVLGTGAETNFYGVEGAEEHSLQLKNLADAIDIRNRIVDMCEQAAVTEDEAMRKKLLSFVVVGGGPTGVECVAEITEFVCETISSYYKYADIAHDAKITLVCTSPTLLPQFDAMMHEVADKVLAKKGVVIKAGISVTKVTADEVVLSDNTSISTSFVLWVAGVKPSALPVKDLTYHKSGRVNVEQTLQAVGHAGVFVLGDVSAFTEAGAQGPVPMLAQVAEQQAEIVARNIIASVEKKPLIPFTYHSKGTLVSLGRWNAVGKIYGMTLQGPFMWWLWRTIYLFKFLSWRKKMRIVTEWTITLFYPRDITKLR